MRDIYKSEVKKFLNHGTLILAIILLSFFQIADIHAKGIADIISSIQSLESDKDPKCHATASRLENFMFGTPLTDEARFVKNDLQSEWVEHVWRAASEYASKQKSEVVDEKHIDQALIFFNYKKNNENDWIVQLPDSSTIIINKHDERQYGSIAYSLRAILAVQQRLTLDTTWNPLPLSKKAIDKLKLALDVFTLAALKLSDQHARLSNQYKVEKDSLVNVWAQLIDDKIETDSNDPVSNTVASARPTTPNQLLLLKQIIEQKVASYQAYNHISNQLFVRNLQVYFARNRWPEDPEVAKKFKGMFTETLIAFATDLYKGAESIALKRGHSFIKDSDVSEFVGKFIPHRINEYEDAIFFPALTANKRVEIESYDMDAFRDSGIHWRYLQFAIENSEFEAYLEPDPFASELIVENIAQFGVLSLRMAGLIGKEQGDKRLDPSHFTVALQEIQKRINENADASKLKRVAPTIISSVDSNIAAKFSENTYFTETSESSGINYMHRSSDWLNRLLRSYLKKDSTTGIITIPPAFGGSGVAAEDINNDGLDDVLFLGGLGNKLYANRGNGKFDDITDSAGLNWKRKNDDLPGEPRQPIIADFDNDGKQDIFISYVNDAHRLYKNLGNEKFEDLTATANLGGEALVGGPATVFDYDNDGLLDIYITYFGDYLNGVLPTLKRRNSNGLPNRLFKNLGNFRFKDVTKGSNLDHSGWAQAVIHTDLDNDGLQDLIVGNDFGINAYFKNLGDGKFKDISSDIGTDKPSYTMNIGITDLNDDLIPDIYISNIVTMNKDEKYVLPSDSTEMKFNPEKLAHMRVVEANDLFISRLLEDKTISYELSKLVDRGYSSTGWSWDADFFDYDNDGDDDLYVLNGMNEFNLYSSENPYYTDPLENKKKEVYIPVDTKEANVFFVNEKGRLQNFSKKSGMDFLGNSRSAAYLDIDQDGDQDVVVNNYHGRAVLYQNNSETLNNNWIKIKLIGTPEKGVNRDAIGARIIVTTEKGRRLWREIHGSTGYMSVHPKLQHFGLGKSTKASALIIWPNGDQKVLPNITMNKTYTIRHGNPIVLNTD